VVTEIDSEAGFNIIAEWYTWTPALRDKTLMNGFLFFCYLQRHRPHLLNFECSGDPWQHVHSWLLQAGVVKD
jgi:hypothetical protein